MRDPGRATLVARGPPRPREQRRALAGRGRPDPRAPARVPVGASSPASATTAAGVARLRPSPSRTGFQVFRVDVGERATRPPIHEAASSLYSSLVPRLDDCCPGRPGWRDFRRKGRSEHAGLALGAVLGVHGDALLAVHGLRPRPCSWSPARLPPRATVRCRRPVPRPPPWRHGVSSGGRSCRGVAARRSTRRSAAAAASRVRRRVRVRLRDRGRASACEKREVEEPRVS